MYVLQVYRVSVAAVWFKVQEDNRERQRTGPQRCTRTGRGIIGCAKQSAMQCIRSEPGPHSTLWHGTSTTLPLVVTRGVTSGGSTPRRSL